MKLSSFKWLLCATVLSSVPAFAEEPATKAETNPPLSEQPADVKLLAEKYAAGSEDAEAKPSKAEEVIEPASPQNYAGAMTLKQAIQRALDNSPRLKVSQASFLASKGEQRQAGAWANPSVGVELENFGGKNDLRGFNSTETTVGINQLIEIGGKRSARQNISDQGVALAQFDNEAARLDLIRDVELAYADAVAAQAQVRIAEDEKDRATAMLKTVKQRVGAAREPLIQQSKAEVTFASAEIGVEQAKKQLAAAKKALAVLWQGDVNFTLDDGAFYNITQPQVLMASSDNLKSNPDFARYDNQLQKSKAALDLEQANAIPDPTFSVGVRDFRETGDKAFVAGLSIPIPVFNANRGNIEKARQELSRTQSEKDVSGLSLSANLVKEQAELETAYQQAISLKEKILPSAEKAFRLSREGYGIGKFPYLEVLDAQRTLFDTREQYLNTLKNYHRAKAEVERLTAAHKAQENLQENNHE